MRVKARDIRLKKEAWHVWVNPDDFVLPEWSTTKKAKKHPNYNSTWISPVEGEIRNCIFWLRENNIRKAHEIINAYYEEKVKENSRIYSKRMNSTIETI